MQLSRFAHGTRAGMAALLAAGLMAGANTTFAGALFPIETLDPSGVLATDASPDGGHWDAFGATTARSSVTRLTHAVRIACAPGDAVSLSKTTDFDPAPATLMVTFDLAVAAAEPSTQMLRVGSGFGASNTDEPDAATFARLAIRTTGTGTFELRDLATGRGSAALAGTQAVTWALNRSGAPQLYAAPNGTPAKLASGRMDVWVGATKVIDGAAALNARVPMTDLKWFWSGAGTATLTNFQVAELPPPDADAAAARAASSTATEEGAPAPALELYRPSPNPFTRTTRFAYAVPATASVDVGIFDVAGRRVRGLVSGTQGAGQYEVAWDGRADDGSRANAGVYFLRASVGGPAKVMRVVYLVR